MADFNLGFVLKLTLRNVRRAIDISIRKTFERIHEFNGNDEKGREIYHTLNLLHTLRKIIDDFQKTYVKQGDKE